MREIELKPSRLLGVLLAALAGTALVAIGLAAMPFAAKLAVAVVVVVAWSRCIARPEAPASLRLMPDGRLQAPGAAGEWRELEVLGDSFVSPLLVVLRYRMAGAPPRNLVLLPDSAVADDLRRIRVSLRWARRTRSDTSSPGAG